VGKREWKDYEKGAEARIGLLLSHLSVHEKPQASISA
jgi:hypothetical protein